MIVEILLASLNVKENVCKVLKLILRLLYKIWQSVIFGSIHTFNFSNHNLPQPLLCANRSNNTMGVKNIDAKV